MKGNARRIRRVAAAGCGLLGLLLISGLGCGVAGADGDAPGRAALGAGAESWIRARLVADAAAAPDAPDAAPPGMLSAEVLGTGFAREVPERPVSRSVATSRLKAMGASMVLPGWGQLLTGHRDRARLFLTAEAMILISYVAFNVQGEVRKNGYIDYAEQFAGAGNVDDRPDWYYRNLADYNSSDEYLDDVERIARAMYGNDLERRREYVEKNSAGPDEAWEWESTADRLEYRSQRKASRNAFRSATHVLGIALLNRLVSAVDAAISASRGNRDRALYYQPTPDGGGYLCMRWMLD